MSKIIFIVFLIPILIFAASSQAGYPTTSNEPKVQGETISHDNEMSGHVDSQSNNAINTSNNNINKHVQNTEDQQSNVLPKNSKSNKDRVVYCDVEGCKSSFTHAHSLKNHLKEKHPDVFKFECAICKREQEKLKQQNPGAKSEKMIEQRFEKVKGLYAHGKKLHPEDFKYNCRSQTCPNFFRTFSERNKHESTCPIYAARKGKKKSGADLNLQVQASPVKTVDAPQTVGQKFRRKCPIETCDRIFDSLQGLHEHLRREHDSATLEFSCQYCSRKFASHAGVYQHQLELHETALRRDLETSRPIQIVPELMCPDCGNSVKDQVQLQAHQIREHGGLPRYRQTQHMLPPNGSEKPQMSVLQKRKASNNPNLTVVGHEKRQRFQTEDDSINVDQRNQPLIAAQSSWKCPLNSCSTVFKTEQDLVAHMARGVHFQSILEALTSPTRQCPNP